MRRIAALMKGERVEWPEAPLDAATFLAVCDRNGATPLVARRHTELPEQIGARMAAEGRVHLAHAAVRERELDALLARLAQAGVRMLVFKGAALARTHYAHPALRPRCDTDVLIERDALEDCARVLEEAGYREESSSGGERIRRQRIWTRTDGIGLRHSVDLHWALANRERYARAFSFVELWSRGVPLHGADIRMPCAADALLLAALHLAAHHRGSERLIWLFDIHLLRASLSADALEAVAAMARERGIGRALSDALALAAHWFEGHAAAPQRAGGALRDLLEDLRFTRGLRGKLRLVAEHLLPPASYVLQKYGVTSRALLPALYVRRAVAGSARLLRQGRGSETA